MKYKKRCIFILSIFILLIFIQIATSNVKNATIEQQNTRKVIVVGKTVDKDQKPMGG